jgi:hypothetical protein
METTEADSTDVSILLSTDVYQDHLEFTDMVRDAINSTDSDTPEEAVRYQAELLLSTVGRDLLKLHGLIRVVYTEMESKLPWAKVRRCQVL